MTRRARTVCACVMVAMVSAVFAGGSASSAAPSEQESPTVWLCRPGMKDNPCESALTTTVVDPNGKKTTQHAAVAKDPPVDCFYVYPTVSAQQSVNATLDVDPELIAVAENQAARFSQVCRVYAPVYPQLTLSSIGQGRTGSAGVRRCACGMKEYCEVQQGPGSCSSVTRRDRACNPAAQDRGRSHAAAPADVGVAARRNVTVPEGGRGGDFQNIPAPPAKETHCGCVLICAAAGGLFGKTCAGAGRNGGNLCVSV